MLGVTIVESLPLKKSTINNIRYNDTRDVEVTNIVSKVLTLKIHTIKKISFYMY